VPPIRLLLLLLLPAIALIACGGGGGAPDARSAPASAPAGAARPVSQSDLEIADLLYTDRARVPAGFYVEPPRYDSSYLTISQLRNTDLAATTAAAHELCSDDPGEALGWSEAVAQAAPVYGDLVETNDREQYHEFVRALRVTPARHAIARVYKCAWLDRDAVDLAKPDGAAGVLGKPAWTAADLLWVAEYTFTFSPDNNAGRVVLTSRADVTASGATHSLILARLARAVQGCDRIEVWRQDLAATRATGALLRSDTLLWAFGASRSGGTTQLCS
jgi:hypothetical protein